MLSDKTGLPQNTVYSIAETNDGFLWFGTEEGVARYDGLHVVVFNTLKNKNLKDNYINVLTVGRDGTLWIGTRSGVNQLKDGVFRSSLNPGSPIDDIHEDRDGRVWVSTLNGLYCMKSGHTRRFTQSDGLPSMNIGAIVETGDGSLWFATAKGLTGFKDGRFTIYTTRHGLPDGAIRNLAASRDGSLWIATDEGLTHWKGTPLQKWPASSFAPHATIQSLLEDRDGVLWIALAHHGIASLREGKVVTYTMRQGLPSDDTNRLFEDRAGHLWIGLLEGGVVELRDGLFSSFGVPEGLSANMVWSVLQARDGSTWVGTEGRGLNHIGKDGAVSVFTMADGLPENTVYALCEAADGSIWIGGEHGDFTRFKNGRFTQFRDPAANNSRLPVILQDASGDLWLGFHQENGLERFHDGHFQHFLIPGLLNTVAFAPDGSIWVGTDHAGVSHLKNDVITTYTTAQGLLSNFSQAIYVDRDGAAWAGTSPGGLNRIKDGHITTYSVEQGLFDLTVGAIIEDDSGNLWMTCNNGIFRVSKQELNDYAQGRIHSIHSIVYGNADGLRATECNFAAIPAVWKGSDKRLWFATVGGIASIDPNYLRSEPADLQLHIEHVLLNQNPTALKGGSIVGRSGNDLEVEFTAPYFSSAEKIRFRYRLQHFDRGWVNVGGRREAYYTKLPPGHYVFEVQAAMGDGPWSSNSATLNLVLQPRFWETAWFRLVCALVFLSLCGAVFKLRVRYLVVRNRDLEERVSLRTQELREAIKVAEAAQEALRELATKDGLTRLWNRRSIFEILNHEIERGRREVYSVCVLMADLDYFKQVNDTYGHLAGDGVLQEVASRMMALARPYDTIGRYGGEELLVVLSRCKFADGLKRAEEFRVAIASTPVPVGPHSISVSCSFGISVGDGLSSAQKLIDEADQALYSAKRTGRNRVHTYEIGEPCGRTQRSRIEWPLS